MGIKKCRHRARNCCANRSGVFQYPHMKEADAEELMNYAVRHWDPFCAVAIWWTRLLLPACGTV